MLEIAPMQAPLTLFVWSKTRILPVRLTDFSITEEAFDPNLNPIRAKVSLGMRVLNVNDVGFDHKAGGLFMIYHQRKEQLAAMSAQPRERQIAATACRSSTVTNEPVGLFGDTISSARTPAGAARIDSRSMLQRPW